VQRGFSLRAWGGEGRLREFVDEKDGRDICRIKFDRLTLATPPPTPRSPPLSHCDAPNNAEVTPRFACAPSPSRPRDACVRTPTNELPFSSGCRTRQ
jgi:hypothetical protein